MEFYFYIIESKTLFGVLLVKSIDTLIGLGFLLRLVLWLGFPYVRMGDVCTYPHYFQATSNL